MESLNELKDVNVRKQWEDEARDFTPWVASRSGLDLIGKALDLSLEEESSAEEVSVGRYNADVVCIDAERRVRVVIENQLATFNHDHLGKALTYATGLNANIVIWVATEFNDEHIKTIDWLIRNTAKEINLFAVKVRLVCIGDSPRAAVFEVIAKPDGWSGNPPPEPLPQSKEENLRFWKRYVEHLNLNRTAGSDHWMNFGVGSTLATLSAARLRSHGSLRFELYMRGNTNRTVFNNLHSEKQSIESEIGFDLKWVQNPDTSSIRATNDMDPSDESQWEKHIEWFADMRTKFDKVFRSRLQNINLAVDLTERPEEEDSP